MAAASGECATSVDGGEINADGGVSFTMLTLLGRRRAFLHGLNEEPPPPANRSLEETDELRLVQERLLGARIATLDDEREFERSGVPAAPQRLVVPEPQASGVALVLDDDRIASTLEADFPGIAEAAAIEGAPGEGRGFLHFVDA